MKDVLGNHLKDRSFRLVHWLSITLFLRKTSQESINLERKSYLDCSSDTLCTRGNLEGWHVGCRHWGVGNDGRIWNLLEKTQCERGDISQRKWKIIFQSQMDESNFPGGDQELRTSTLIRQRPIRGEGQFWFSWRIRRVSSTTSRLISGCWWSDKWFLVHVRKLHIPPSRWTKSQTLLAERRIIPYSTEIHWRLQNYTHTNLDVMQERRIDDYWNIDGSREFVWFLDRFHPVYSTRRETSRRNICGPGRDWQESR